MEGSEIKAMVKTALTESELGALSVCAAGKLVYEAGALLGASTIALAAAAKLVVSVDPHDGYPARDPSPTWEQFRLNMRLAGVQGKVQPVRARLQDALPVADYGLAFADLTGTYGDTLDFLMATRHVATVGVHDYGRAGCEGATDAVDRFLKWYRRRVWRVDTLILMEASL